MKEKGGQGSRFQQRGSPGMQIPHPGDTKDEDDWTLVSVSYYFPGYTFLECAVPTSSRKQGLMVLRHGLLEGQGGARQAVSAPS